MMRALSGFMLISLFSAALAFFAIPLGTRLVEQDVLGQVNLLVSIALVLSTIAIFGFDQGYLRFYYEQKNAGSRKRLLFLSSFTPLAVALFFVTVFFVWRDWLGSYLGGDSLAVSLCLGCLVVALILIRFAICFCRVSNWLWLFGLFTIINILFSKCAYLLGFGEKGFSAIAATIAIVAAIAIAACAVFLLKFNWPRYEESGGSLFRDLCRYSAPLMPAMLLSNLNAAIPLFMIRAVIDFNAAGLFSMTVTVAAVVNVIGSGVNSFWPTYVFQHYASKQHIVQLFHQVLVSGMFVLASILIMLRFMIPVFLGESYMDASPLFAILLISPFCYTVGETAGTGIHIAKKSSFFLGIYAVGLVLNVILCALLLHCFGVMGAAISVAVTAAIMLFLKAIIGGRLYNSTGSLRWVFSSVFLLGVQAFSCQLVESYAATVCISVACLAFFPFLVGIEKFSYSCREALGFLCALFRRRGL